MNGFGSFLKTVASQVVVMSVFSSIDESVRTLIRERVKRSRLCPQTNLGN